MKQLHHRIIRFRVFLILKCFSIISFLIINSACKQQKQKLRTVTNETNSEFLKKTSLPVDTNSNAEAPVVRDTIVPVYDPSIEVICDYGVIPAIEPPDVESTLYGVEPDFYEENDPLE